MQAHANALIRESEGVWTYCNINMESINLHQINLHIAIRTNCLYFKGYDQFTR